MDIPIKDRLENSGMLLNRYPCSEEEQAMLMNQELPVSSRIVTPQACLEWTTAGPQDIYLFYDQAHYRQSSTSDGWWQRTLALDSYHWLRLSGAADTSPWEAIRALLQQPNRSHLSLPALVVALFLARSIHPDTWEQRYLFRWVLSALPEVRTSIPAGSFYAGWVNISTDTWDPVIQIVINVLLQHDPEVPWALPDGEWLQLLDQLAEALWCFLPNTTRGITHVVATHLEQLARSDQKPARTAQHAARMARWSAIGDLSAIRFWHEPWPTIRGLPIQSSILDFLQLWYQALVIMHPDAPPISATHFSWLCHGRIGAPDDGPFNSLLAARANIEGLGLSATEWQQRIVVLKQEAARGTCRPSGCWEVSISSQWPILSAYGVATMQVVVGPKGCWVRLIPAEASWGSVLWWRPEKGPPTCWALALGEALSSVPALALHETFWQMWRELRIYGRPVQGNAATNP